MKHPGHLVLFLILFFLPTFSAMAQEQPPEYALPSARVGEDYRAEIESVLREKYQLRLESGNTDRVIRWTMSSGEVPSGLSVQTDGTIIGRPSQVRTGIYQFSLKAVDVAVRDESLELRFSLEVKAGRLRLSRIDGSRLTPSDFTAVLAGTVTEIVSSTISPAANNAAASEEADSCPNPAPITITGKVTIKNDRGQEDAKSAKVVFSNVKSSGNTEAQPWAITKTDGTYSLNVNADPTCQYVLKASVGDSSVDAPYTTGTNTVNLDLVVRPLGEFSRAIVGLEQAGASSAKSTQRFFMDLSLSAPLPWGKIDPFFARRARAWGSVRITSVPQQITTGVAEFAGAFAQRVGEVKVNELAQGAEFLAGGEFRLVGSKSTLHFGSFGRDTSTRLSLSLIVGGGIITPFNPRDTIEVFKVFRDTPGFPTGIPEGKDFIAFVSSDRDRFFRQYYGGFRLQTHYFDYDNPNLPLKRYPATLDITYGQNEAVTGGRLRGGVFRLEGFYPLPYEGLKFINLFGTALIKPARTQITDPLILEAAPSGTTVPANNVFLLTIPQINRDYYRVGVGIDFISLISKWRAASH